MKLYTEEQVRQSLMKHQNAAMLLSIEQIDYLIEEITHIQIPSDEEIKTYLNNHSYEFENGFKDAIEFIKNKIQGGKKWH